MRAFLTAVVSLICTATPIAAQVVTVTTPLPDKSGDGHVTVSSMAAQLGVPKGTVLTRCGQTLTYVGPKSVCPSLATATIAPDPYELHPPVAPRDVTPTATDAHKLKDATIPAGLYYHDETGRTRGYIVATGGPVNNLLVERAVIVCRATCLNLKRAGGPTTIRDVEVSQAGVDTSNGYQAGFKLDKGQHDVLFERDYAHDWQSTVPPEYPNADCFGNERSNYNVTYRYTRAARCTDGAYDLKSTGTLLDNTKAEGPGRYAYRLWGAGTGTDVYATGQFHAGIQMKPLTNYTIARWHNAGLTADADVVSDGVPAATDHPVLHIGACDRPMVIRVGKGFTVDAGTGCK